MFGRKKKPTMQPSVSTARIETIPDVFYGGNDPEIYHHAATGPAAPAAPQKNATPPNSAAAVPGGTSALLSSKTLWWGGGALGFLLVVGGISWFYLKDYAPGTPTPTAPTAVPPIVPTTTPAAEPAPPPPTSTPVEAPIGTPTTSPESVPTPVSLGPAALDLPPLIFGSGTDLDEDELTDLEEEIFSTDSGTWDTDGDGYYDGQEVVNLYNPRGSAPIRLIDSGRVGEYINPRIRYRVYYPRVWEAGSVDQKGEHVLFSASNGEYVSIRVFAREPGQSFTDWFAERADNQRITDVLRFANRFELDGYRRRDGLVAYFTDDSWVYVLSYHPRSVGVVEYPHVMQMMIMSFRYAASDERLPEQPVLPPENGFTTTSVAN